MAQCRMARVNKPPSPQLSNPDPGHQWGSRFSFQGVGGGGEGEMNERARLTYRCMWYDTVIPVTCLHNWVTRRTDNVTLILQSHLKLFPSFLLCRNSMTSILLFSFGKKLNVTFRPKVEKNMLFRSLFRVWIGLQRTGWSRSTLSVKQNECIHHTRKD